MGGPCTFTIRMATSALSETQNFFSSRAPNNEMQVGNFLPKPEKKRYLDY